MATTTKPQLPSLKTPLSAGFPSEMRSPCVGTPTYIKQEDSQKTPITPPAAYLDFLSKLSPTLMTPLPTGTRFTFPPEKPALTSQPSTDSVATTSSSATSASFTSTAPAESSRPTSPRSKSSRSSSLSSSTTSEGANQSKKRSEPGSSSVSSSIPTGKVIPPPSPFARPMSARTPRRLHIPQSPYSPASVRSPLSASSIYSPYSAAWSPRDPSDPEKGRTTHMSVRQVVTRTVTHYARTPIVEPVPASKKRKIEPTEEES